MKKIVSLIAALLVCATGFAGCGAKDTYTLYVPDGAPILAVAGMWEDSGVEIGGKTVKFELAKGGDAIRGAITGKKPDIALAPIIYCAESFNTTGGEYVYLGTAVNGLLYIVSRNGDDVSSLDGLDKLKGETLYAFQRFATPGLTLIAVLEKNEIPYKILSPEDDAVDAERVNLQFLASPLDVRNALTVGIEGKTVKYGLLAEPLVTSLTAGAAPALVRELDVQSLWGGESYPQVGVIVRKSIADGNPDFISALCERFEQSAQWAKDNADAAATKSKDVILSSELPAAAGIKLFLQGSGRDVFGFTRSSACKENVKGYLSAIASENLALVGGALPADAFYL